MTHTPKQLNKSGLSLCKMNIFHQNWYQPLTLIYHIESHQFFHEFKKSQIIPYSGTPCFSNFCLCLCNHWSELLKKSLLQNKAKLCQQVLTCDRLEIIMLWSTYKDASSWARWSIVIRPCYNDNIQVLGCYGNLEKFLLLGGPPKEILGVPPSDLKFEV